MPLNIEETNKIQQEKDSALNFRKRRHPDWNVNYTLYRDKPEMNRLTQRQNINIPLMKYGIASLMKDIDEPPMLYFENLDNDVQREIFLNEIWNEDARRNKLVIRDRIDKKTACLYGRPFKKLNIVDGRFAFTNVDPQDMLIERHVDPAQLDSARCIIQTGIYQTLTNILENKEFDESGKSQLRDRYSKTSNTQEQSSNFENFTDKVKRMADMGLIDAYDPVVGETYIELNEVYRSEYDAQKDWDIIQVYILAVTDAGMIQLQKKPLHEKLGKTEDNFWYEHFPYTSWATDPEGTDFWSDAPADIIRQPNVALNIWISQLSENRTLRNFNMHYYDSTNIQFVPQTFSPVAWGWYPVPGNPNEVIKDVVVGDLSESLDEMQFVIGIAEKALAVSGSQTGAISESKVTLGEVEIAVQNAQERTKSMIPLYEEDWKEFGLKYVKMLEGANNLGILNDVTIHKKGRGGKKIYKKELKPDQYLSKGGWKVVVKMKSDKVNEDTALLQRLSGLISLMPNNVPLKDIQKKHAMEFAGLTSDEMKEVMDFEMSNPLINNGVENMGITPPANAGTEVPGQATPPVAIPNIGGVL